MGKYFNHPQSSVYTSRENEASESVLALMELSEEKSKVQTKFVPIHRTATMVDDRYNITEEENDEVLKRILQRD